MTTKKKVKSFVREFCAVVQGNTDKQIAEVNYRKSDHALSAHIFVLKGDLITAEQLLEDAKEDLYKARHNNGKNITDRDDYVQNLISAKNNVDLQQEKCDEIKLTLEFLEEELKTINEEVDSND